ncbi:MAG: 16S rRNA (adenine(1518)-N(6)/adenine(1519)-N(6))-dimethyltransferase RsmA [Candidatus Omnitrophota bacterium]
MLSIKETKNALEKLGAYPNKRLGQNFLIDRNIQEKMISYISRSRPDTILEIGPGLGAITGALCGIAKRVIAVEKDKLLYKFLKDSFKEKNIDLINGDILKYSLDDIGKKIIVVGNLPYYITSPLITRFLDGHRLVESMFVTVQREVAERLVAGPGGKDYGSISCFVRFYSDAKIVFNIKKGSFYPTPKVDSSFMEFKMRIEPLYLTDEEKLFKIIKTCFEKRRKTILNSLCSSDDFGTKKEVFELLKLAGIQETRRPETISLEEYTAIVNSMEKSIM